MSFFPTQYKKSVFDIDFVKLWALGYRGIIFDIDATLVPHGLDATQQVIELFDNLHQMGFGTLLLSNNNEVRIRQFNQNIQTHYIADANKPNPANYLRALSILGLPHHQVVMVGDQLFTDMLGANRANIASILVDFLPQQGETRLGKKRTVEKWLMSIYRFLPNANRLERMG